MERAVSFALIAANIASAQYIEPNCNFVEGSNGLAHFPIGGCHTVESVDNTFSFQYVCNDAKDAVYRYDYTATDCLGEVNITMNTTGEVTNFECGLSACSYAISCEIGSCSNDTSCSECIQNEEDFDRYCKPYITNQCYGFEGTMHYAMCSEEALLDKTYYNHNGTACEDDDGTFVYNITYGGDEPEDYCQYYDYDDYYYHYAVCVDADGGMPTDQPTNEPTMEPTMDPINDDSEEGDGANQMMILIPLVVLTAYIF